MMITYDNCEVGHYMKIISLDIWYAKITKVYRCYNLTEIWYKSFTTDGSLAEKEGYFLSSNDTRTVEFYDDEVQFNLIKA